MPRQALSVYLPDDLLARVKRLAADQHRSDSSLVTDIVKARLGRGAGLADQTGVEVRTLFRIDARLDKIVGETLILKEVLLLFIRIWLEHTPPVEEDFEESAAASAEARFERFLDMAAQALAPGGSLASYDLATSQDVGAGPAPTSVAEAGA